MLDAANFKFQVICCSRDWEHKRQSLVRSCYLLLGHIDVLSIHNSSQMLELMGLCKNYMTLRIWLMYQQARQGTQYRAFMDRPCITAIKYHNSFDLVCCWDHRQWVSRHWFIVRVLQTTSKPCLFDIPQTYNNECSAIIFQMSSSSKHNNTTRAISLTLLLVVLEPIFEDIVSRKIDS